MNDFLPGPPPPALPTDAAGPAAPAATRIGAATFDAARSVNRHHAERQAAAGRPQAPPPAAS